ncbi:lipopolysaccharide biosynthesis protein [Rhodonellum sp.]|uniref:lipopolysaccharide biosynthesis protein n=1 Tax=Rhodonellum sp. TaxID=2231180 RepID=UPI002720DA39|nr:oligosaccharide flippase family protein [Rhodonellum sp.]MDO9551435.1 oligosaccharide flippase family protein [Rhodonellum sp.]
MLKAFFKDSAIYTLPSLVSRGLSFFLFPLYTQVLSPTDYGAFDILVVFGNLITLTVALEISQGVARYYTEEQDPDKKIVYASTSFWFSLVCYFLFMVFSLIFSTTLTGWLLDDKSWSGIFQLYTLHIFLYGLFCLIQNQFRWEFRSKTYALISIIVTLTTAGVSVYLAYFLKWGIHGILYGLISGSFVGCVYGLWNLRSTYQLKFDSSYLKKMITFSAPLIPSSIAVFMSLYIDRLMINHYLSLEEVGIYGIGYRLASIVGLLMIGFKGALTPLIYNNYNKKNTPKDLAVIFRYFSAAALMIFLGLSIFSKEILTIITTPAYIPASQVVIYLIPAVFFSNMYVFAPGITITKKTHFLIYINMGGALVNFLLNLVLIPRYGISGAAIATFIGYGFVFGVHMIISQKLYFVPHKWKQLVLAIGVFGLIAGFGLTMDSDYRFNFLIKLGILIMTIPLVVLLKLILKKEVVQVYVFVKHRFFPK